MSLYLGDAIACMGEIRDADVDMVLVDPPYGTTACKWDSVIPFEPMWAEVNRVLVPGGAAVFTASQPFTSALVMSNARHFRHAWVWNKRFAANFALAKVQPLKVHEDVLVFASAKVRYYPQMIQRDKPIKLGKNVAKAGSANLAHARPEYDGKTYTDKNPETILFFDTRAEGQVKLHPTQKPVGLMRYLICTYTRPGDTVLDFTMGSGTTGVAAAQTARRFIGIENDETYFEIAQRRIAAANRANRLL